MRVIIEIYILFYGDYFTSVESSVNLQIKILTVSILIIFIRFSLPWR